MLAVAVAAARRAGAIQLEKFRGDLNVDAKPVGDLKLEADRLCEQAIVDALRQRYPSHAIVAEESGRADGAEYVWYVDPLDGTVNYYFGIPHFCTTLACYRQTGAADDPVGMGEPLLGVTYAPVADEMFVGVIGRGATLNGRPVRVREVDSLADAFVTTTIGNKEPKISFTREWTLELSPKLRKTRNLGACALDLAYVAAGLTSGSMEYGLSSWDVAAGRVLVEAAGGVVSMRAIEGGQVAIVASGRNIHPELAAALRWEYGG